MREYGAFRSEMQPGMQDTFDSLREYCLSLGKNVVEDVRAHRVVFGKSFVLRWFVDAMPTDNSILVRIQRSRREPAATVEIRDGRQLQDAKGDIRDAFLSI